MGHPRAWVWDCDGEGCERSIGDVGLFLRIHTPEEPQRSFCPDCSERLGIHREITGAGTKVIMPPGV